MEIICDIRKTEEKIKLLSREVENYRAQIEKFSNLINSIEKEGTWVGISSKNYIKRINSEMDSYNNLYNNYISYINYYNQTLEELKNVKNSSRLVDYE